jgi:Uma2 family endonuclease
MSPSTLKPRRDGVEAQYPDSDGESMAENDLSRELMIDCIHTLEDYFEAQSDVYVSGGILIYYKEDDPRKRVAPDVFVARGVAKKKRLLYHRWVEGKMPDVILDIATGDSWASELGPKASLYYTLGVQEVYVFDPTGQKFGEGPLFGMARDEAGFSVLPPDEHGRLQSAILGLDLFAEQSERADCRLRFFDPDTLQILKNRKEKLADERTRREEAERRASTAEAEVRKLREELQHLRGAVKP